MEQWREYARKEAVITDIDTLVPADHLLRKIERVMDYDWLYERLEPCYNHEVGCPSIDPVVLIKMVLLQHPYVVALHVQLHKQGFFDELKHAGLSHERPACLHF